MDKNRPVRVLMLEDSVNDAEIEEAALLSAGLSVECRRVTSRTEFESALESFAPDVVLLDYNLPGFDGRTALELMRQRYSDIPAVVSTGMLGDEAAVELLKAGASDYVLKDRPHRLPSAVKRAIEEGTRRRERIAAQRELEANLVLLRTEHESSPDGILVVDGTGRVISQNRRFVEMWRLPEDLRETISDAETLKFVTRNVNDPDAFAARVAYLYAHPEEKSREEIETMDGRTFDRFSSPMVDSQGKYLGRVWFFHDITEERAAEQQMRLFRLLIDKSNDTMMVIDPESLRVIDANERACINLGYTRDELLARQVFDLDPMATPEGSAATRRNLQASGKTIFESVHKRKDGTTFPVETSLSLATADRPYTLAVTRDITERKRAQKALEDSEVRFRTLIEDASDPVAIIGGDGAIVYASPATLEMSGYPAREMVGKNVGDFTHPDDASAIARQFAAVRETPGTVRRLVARLRHREGAWRSAEIVIRNRLGVAPIDGMVLTISDVTERERTLRALAAMRATDAVLVRASEEQTLSRQICNIMVEIGGYRMAWIGFPQMDEQKSIEVVATAGEAGPYLETPQITWDDSDLGSGPTGIAIRTGLPQVNRNYAAQSAPAVKRAEARERGYTACVAIPLAGREGVFGVITLYANDPAAFDDDEVALLEQLSADVSYGIEAMRERKQHALDLLRLEQIMEATIFAIAATVERRDAYTAGHQRRVAHLCVAIARELGLKPERVRGLELAAMIHDMGKIETPTEILTKPRSLSELEYAMIKLHPEAGYQILRNIDFPWPIAEMVRQHHEKIDGSGYPLGLKGEEILLESRILTVADVVEAMSSHRPYRAGWGIEAALYEIVKGRGTLFDAQVTDACTRLFREKRFQFEDAAAANAPGASIPARLM